MLDQGPDAMSATQDAGSGDLSWPQDQGIPLSEDPQSGCDCQSTHGKGHLVLGLSLILAALRKREGSRERSITETTFFVKASGPRPR